VWSIEGAIAVRAAALVPLVQIGTAGMTASHIPTACNRVAIHVLAVLDAQASIERCASAYDGLVYFDTVTDR
jgi:hypothetical protein